MELFKNKIFRLQGKVQHYAWGGFNYLSELLNLRTKDGEPNAEYWLGAHESASSLIMVSDNQEIPLIEYINDHPTETLGADVANAFHQLPYLLKILDVRDMLSIQVHPTKKNAELEFAEEIRRNVDATSPIRNYKDDNHKPELMLALGEFWLLHGFKPKAKLDKLLQEIPELNVLSHAFKKGYAHLYGTVMEMDQEKVNHILQPLLDRIIPEYRASRLTKDSEDFWAARAALTFNSPGKIDRGIFSIYFFNLLSLQPGEAIFQDAGLPHAYLEGQNVEIMANSDNVLRGGLTPKHIDVAELMKHIHFEETIPSIIYETKKDVHVGSYITPAPDFQLNKISIQKGEKTLQHIQSTNIFFVLKGEITVNENEKNIFRCGQGQSWVGFNDGRFAAKAGSDTVIYWASVPVINE